MTGWTWVLIPVGIILALVSLFADVLRLGAAPTAFGWKQILGLVVGLALTAYGLWRRGR
jgi:uncharacterized membrane protein